MVIAITALLVALLLPALGGAREAARTIQCASQMRQVLMGSNQYAWDNKGWLLVHDNPDLVPGAPTVNGHPVDYNIAWYSTDKMGSYIEPNRRYVTWSLGTSPLMQCPSMSDVDKWWIVGAGEGHYQLAGSYNPNGWFFCWWSWGHPWTHSSLKFENVRSDVPYWIEAPRQGNQWASGHLSFLNYSGVRFSHGPGAYDVYGAGQGARGGSMNIAFIDGHVGNYRDTDAYANLRWQPWKK